MLKSKLKPKYTEVVIQRRRHCSYQNHKLYSSGSEEKRASAKIFLEIETLDRAQRERGRREEGVKRAIVCLEKADHSKLKKGTEASPHGFEQSKVLTLQVEIFPKQSNVTSLRCDTLKSCAKMGP